MVANGNSSSTSFFSDVEELMKGKLAYTVKKDLSPGESYILPDKTKGLIVCTLNVTVSVFLAINGDTVIKEVYSIGTNIGLSEDKTYQMGLNEDGFVFFKNNHTSNVTFKISIINLNGL